MLVIFYIAVYVYRDLPVITNDIAMFAIAMPVAGESERQASNGSCAI